MRGTDEEFEREDALVCADVLGGFGVSSDHVREHVPDVGADADAEDLESAIQRALADPEHPAAFVRRTVASAPRGVDAPVRFWTTAPETQLGDVFAALSWTFDVKSANGRSLSVDDEEPYRLRVEDADGRARSTAFSFPDTALGDDNYPALVHAINAELLYGLACQFVQLSDGTDRWRFALVETEELERLRERFGERVTVFDRPLLAADQPEAYAPDAGDEAGVGDDASEGVPVPSWARDDERSWRGRRVTADAFDADHVGGLDHLYDGDDADANGDVDADTAARNDTGTEADANEDVDVDAEAAASDGDGSASDGAEAAAAVIEFVDADANADADADANEASGGSVSGVTARGGASDVVRDADAEAADDDDLDGWSVGGTVDATTRSPGDGASTSVASSTDPRATGGSTTRDSGGADASSTADISTSGFEWEGDDDGDSADATAGGGGGGASESVVTAGGLRDDDSSTTESSASASSGSASSASASSGSASSGSASSGSASSASVADSSESEAADSGDDGFFSADAAASFDAGAKTSRVEPDSFGVDADEQTEDDQFAAVGAALAAPAGISVGGLLDDDEFLPHLPRTEPEQTRIEFEDEFDPNADASAAERETDDGFVWVNESGGIDEQRTSALD